MLKDVINSKKSSAQPAVAATEAIIPARRRSVRTTSVAKKAESEFEDINTDQDDDEGGSKDEPRLSQKERNKEHSKTSRVRKKLLIDGLHAQVESLEHVVDGLRALSRGNFPGEPGEMMLKGINSETPAPDIKE